MGALVPAAGMQALAATLAASGPGPAVLAAAPILWEVLLRGKDAPPYFAELVPSKSLAVTPFQVSTYAYPVSPRTERLARSVRSISGGVSIIFRSTWPSCSVVECGRRTLLRE